MRRDGRFIISGSSETTVRILNLLNKNQEAVLRGHRGTVYSLCLSGDGRFIASGSYDKTLRI
jgi:WD40 repeat protein